jgi:hypothetical protein
MVKNRLAFLSLCISISVSSCFSGVIPINPPHPLHFGDPLVGKDGKIIYDLDRKENLSNGVDYEIFKKFLHGDQVDYLAQAAVESTVAAIEDENSSKELDKHVAVSAKEAMSIREEIFYARRAERMVERLKDMLALVARASIENAKIQEMITRLQFKLKEKREIRNVPAYRK